MIQTNLDGFTEYLRDESRLPGKADSISFPRSEAEVLEVLQVLSKAKLPLTIQGGRTGIAGGAVPAGGHILNLAALDRIRGLRFDEQTGGFYVRVQPGVLLSALREAVLHKDFQTDDWSGEARQACDLFRLRETCFFSPDPTEPSASLGGMAAANASGARSFAYGPIRNHITALKVALPDGSRIHLRRGEHVAKGLSFRLLFDTGRIVSGTLPEFKMPAVKNAAGYYVHEDMDLLDLFIGSEGTLGIILELELRLLPEPAEVWGITAFLPAEAQAVRFVQTLRRQHSASSSVVLAALEYFDHRALDLLQHEKQSNTAFAAIPRIPAGNTAAVYIEYHAREIEPLEDAIEELIGILGECGGDESDTWIATTPHEMQPLVFFRHAVPEVVNLKIDQLKKVHPSLTKLGTDMAVADTVLEQTLAMYRQGLEREKLNSVIFGHIGNNHLHVNILPANPEEYARGKALYQEWAAEIIKTGGSISAEHGVGKLKTGLLRLMYGEEGIRAMQQLKRLFDPEYLLNPGNLFIED